MTPNDFRFAEDAFDLERFVSAEPEYSALILEKMDVLFGIGSLKKPNPDAHLAAEEKA